MPIKRPALSKFALCQGCVFEPSRNSDEYTAQCAEIQGKYITDDTHPDHPCEGVVWGYDTPEDLARYITIRMKING